jgi:ABC-type oligopeptide transport system substrate-binding subunit
LATTVLASTSDSAESLRFAYSTQSPLSWYHNKDFDALVAAAGSSADEQVQSDYVRRAVRMLHEDLPIIPLWNNVLVYMMRPGVRFTPTRREYPLMQLKDVQLQPPEVRA